MGEDWEPRVVREQELNERAKDFLQPPSDDPPDEAVPIDPPDTTPESDDE